MPVAPSPHPAPPLRAAAGPSPRRPAARVRALAAALALTVAALVALPGSATAATLKPQGPKITVPATAEFGSATALSADGATALIGSPGDDSATVLTRIGDTWTPDATLTPSGGSGVTAFGSAVALSADGTVALVGGPSDAGGVGAAWIFVHGAGGWQQAGAKLTTAEETGAGHLGTSVGLSHDGALAVIGAPLDSGAAGAVWVFSRSGGTWSQLGSRLTPSDEIGNGTFGNAVAIAADGATLAAGGPGDGFGAPGAVWVFTPQNDGTFAQSGTKLTAATKSLGAALALDADGGTLLAGAPGDSSSVGAGYVFTRTGGGVYAQTATLAPTSGRPALGAAAALSADGSVALLGGPGAPLGTGAAFVFTHAATWSAPGELDPAIASGTAAAGSSVALAADGHLALVGGPGDSLSVGAVWPYNEEPVVTSVAPALGDAAGGTSVTITGTGLAGVAAVHFDSVAAGFTVDSPTQITAVAPAGSVGPVDVTVDTSGGTSAISSADTFVYATAPGAPGSPAGARADGSVTVSYAPPASTGGSPVLDYQIDVAPGGQTVQTASTQAVIGGLTNGTTYTFTIRARNAIGLGAPATVSATPNPSPQITGLSTTFGPAAGGTVVTITGVHLTGATEVDFGTTPATGVSVVSDTTVTATTPAHAAAAVHVTVQGPLGPSSTTCADAFAYVPTNGLPLPAHGCAVAFPLHTAGPGGGAPQKVSVNVPTGGSATLLDAGGNPVASLTNAAGRFQLSGGVITYTPGKAYVGAGAVDYRLQGDGGSTATATYSTTVTVPAPPLAPALTSSGDPGVTQQKAIGIVAGYALVLLDAGGRPTRSAIVISGEGRYELSGGAILLFEPDPAFRGRGHGIRYRLTDEYGQSATGSYVPTVAGAATGTSGGPGSPAVRLTTAALNVATASGVVPIGCGLSTGLIADCRVALVATVGVKHVTLGVGVNSPDRAVPSLVVRVALNATGRHLIRRAGGIAVRAQASVSVAGLPGHATGVVALRTVAPSFLLAHSVRFGARSARLSASEKRFLTSLARSLAGVRRIDCIGAARDIRKGSRRTSLAKARARAVCAFLKTRLPHGTAFAPRAERTGDRRGTTRHADLLLRY